ncbi:Hsp33 family molecular chaperone HslO [Oceanicella actignis]|uniref:Hsp33 family molecular chaperone HslO n=1 Tax=Oceanicella actignis TaxID=1189325 RepID=UPI0011E67200|nr:Hsp33 family molecular chaperone HslO [Oceanicella actignis]TYO90057.1 molecular chaperone Hsp33 [Oceanicella actignis]
MSTHDDNAGAAVARPLGAGDDTVLPFQLDRSDIRGRVARLDESLARMLAQHDYPPAVGALTAEAAMLTALIGQTIKLRWKLSLQIRGSGPIRLIATDYYAPETEGAPARMRAWASFDPEAVDPSAPGFAQLGEGVFAILIDQGPGTTPYQGITPLAGGSLAASAQSYFAQSEQIPTRFEIVSALASAPGGQPAWRAGGVMLQQLPAEGGAGAARPEADADGLMTAQGVADMAGRGEDWNRVNLLLDTVDAHELIGPHVTPEALLWRLFHEETPRVYPVQPVRFGCSCSGERVVEALAGCSPDEIAAMTTPEGKVTADCQFCGAHYEFAPEELGARSGGH